jgi:hypothetical protein
MGHFSVEIIASPGHVWMPRSCKDFFERLERVIGCGHVSGLFLRLDFDRWPVWSYADLVQINSASSRLTDPDAFPRPTLTDLCPYLSMTSSHARRSGLFAAFAYAAARPESL